MKREGKSKNADMREGKRDVGCNGKGGRVRVK